MKFNQINGYLCINWKILKILLTIYFREIKLDTINLEKRYISEKIIIQKDFGSIFSGVKY